MATTAQILSDQGQLLGRQITIEWDSGDGLTRRNIRLVDDAVNAQDLADSLISRIESRWKEIELETAAWLTWQGIDPHTLTLRVASTAEMRVHVLKRIVNLMRDGNATDAWKLVGAKVVTDQFTDAQIAGQLDGVNAVQVAAWRLKLGDLVDGIQSYDTGMPEQET